MYRLPDSLHLNPVDQMRVLNTEFDDALQMMEAHNKEGRWAAQQMYELQLLK